jgi:hypothetical protein
VRRDRSLHGAEHRFDLPVPPHRLDAERAEGPLRGGVLRRDTGHDPDAPTLPDERLHRRERTLADELHDRQGVRAAAEPEHLPRLGCDPGARPDTLGQGRQERHREPLRARDDRVDGWLRHSGPEPPC